MTNINTAVNKSVYLGQGGYTSPLNIYSGGIITGNASTYGGTYGVKLTAGFVNNNGGQITGGSGTYVGGGPGVYLAGGTLTNGTLSGAASAITGGAGLVAGSGIQLSGGVLTNNASGRISGGTGRVGGFEKYAVVPPATPTRCENFLASIHVSTKPTC